MFFLEHVLAHAVLCQKQWFLPSVRYLANHFMGEHRLGMSMAVAFISGRTMTSFEHGLTLWARLLFFRIRF